MTEPEVPSQPLEPIEYVSFKEAVKLARMKPDRGFMRNDLLVYGGWLNKNWAWSRDVPLSLDAAIASGLRLGDRVAVVGKHGDAKGTSPSVGGNGDALKISVSPSLDPKPAKQGQRWSLFAPKQKREAEKEV